MEDTRAKVNQVNAILLSGEPENTSTDTLTGYVGYKPQFVVDAMNETFGLGMWGFTDLSSEIVKDEKATLAVAKVDVWIQGVDFRPSGYGQARVTRGDIGDAKKGAQTDAIKKALSYFSIGNRAYQGKLGKQEDTALLLKQVKASVRKAGLASNPSEWQAYKVSRLGKDVLDNELTNNDLDKLSA